MGDKTSIQWCDSTVNPIMGCNGCELFPKASEVLRAIDNAVAATGVQINSKTILKTLVDDAFRRIKQPLAGHKMSVNNTNIWHLREIFADLIEAEHGKAAAFAVSSTIRIKLKCYAAKLHLNKGANILLPERVPHKGHADTFEMVTPFPGRVEKAASLSDLLGKSRTDGVWKNLLPRMIFVSDMGDAFSAPKHFGFLKEDTVPQFQSKEGQRHLWIWLTKRPATMAKFSEEIGGFPPNVCAMTTVTCAAPDKLDRVDDLRRVKAHVRGLSIEPLRERIPPESLNLQDIDWVIVGGESGTRDDAPEFHLEWAEELMDHCRRRGVAFFLKQFGRRPMRNGEFLKLKDAHGGDWEEWDEHLRVREFPRAFKQYRGTELGVVALPAPELENTTSDVGANPPAPAVLRVDQTPAPACGADDNAEGDLPERGCFPIGSLPSVIRDYALELAGTYKVPVELPALCMIGALSGAIGKSWQVANVVPERVTLANLYMVLSLSSGAGKSISNRIARPITKLEAVRSEAFECDEVPKLKSRQIALEADLARIRKAAKEGTIDDRRLQSIVRDLDVVGRALRKSVALSVGNGTTTGLGNELARVSDETLWVYSAEGGHVVDVMLGSSGKHAPHIELWLNGYSGESYNQTRGRSSAGGANCVVLKNVCLSSLLMVQPVVVQKLLAHRVARERGLLARLLVVEIKTRPIRDDGVAAAVSPALEEKWTKLLEGILSQRENPSSHRDLSCSAEATEVFRKFHNDTTCAWSDGAFADLDKELSRWRENAIKLALVLQAATDPASVEVSVEVARDAVILMRWLGIGMLQLSEAQRYERLEMRAEQLVRSLKQRGGECLASSLETRHGFNLVEAQKLARLYPQRFSVREVQRGGRPGNLVKLVQ